MILGSDCSIRQQRKYLIWHFCHSPAIISSPKVKWETKCKTRYLLFMDVKNLCKYRLFLKNCLKRASKKEAKTFLLLCSFHFSTSKITGIPETVWTKVKITLSFSNLQSLQTVKSTEGPIFKGVNFVVIKGAAKQNKFKNSSKYLKAVDLQKVDWSEISESILTNTLDFVGVHQQ